jgi:hypothetical protein
VLRKKRPRRIVPTARFKQIQLVRGPSIHVRAFHRRDVHAQRSMDPRAIEAYKHAEIFRRPLRVRRVAIEAQSVAFFAVQRVEQFVAVVLRRHYMIIYFFLLFLLLPSLCLSVYMSGGGTRFSLSRALLLLWSSSFDFSRKERERVADFLLFRVFAIFFFPAFFQKRNRSRLHTPLQSFQKHTHNKRVFGYIYRHTYIFKSARTTTTAREAQVVALRRRRRRRDISLFLLDLI